MTDRPPTIETGSLLLRAPSPEDVDAVFEIQGDREAMRYTYVAPDRDATARFLDAYAARFHLDGFGPWVALLKGESRVVGWGGLNKDPNAPHWGPEVSYFIHRSYQGRGLATELVRAALELAFRDLGLPEVSAFTMPGNAPSRRVLEKTGFVLVRYVPELERAWYVIRSGDARSGSG